MGRHKGTTEVVLEKADVKQAHEEMTSLMPERVKGALSAAPAKLFNEYATKSVEAQTLKNVGDDVFQVRFFPVSLFHDTFQSFCSCTVYIYIYIYI